MSSSRTGAVPDAWDDDWTSNTAGAGNAVMGSTPAPAAAAKLSKAERRAQHAAQQKQLWDSADNPGRHLWLEAQGAVVPNRQELKPQVMTLLSRKPPPSIVRRGGPAAAGGADDDEDSEEEARRKQAADMEERQRRAKLEHEDKQRRYAEARQRIMGTSAAAAAGTGGLSSGAAASSRENSQQGRRGGGQQKPRNNNFPRRSQPGSPAEQSPARTGGHERPQQQQQQLFDPDGTGRRLLPRRQNSDIAASRDVQPLRQPRGPESSGRGGFGFAPRGGRAVA